MIPSLVVDEVRDSLVEYLASTFALADDDVQESLSAFLEDSADGIFCRSYVSVRTPVDWMLKDFRPDGHQAAAFDRLS